MERLYQKGEHVIITDRGCINYGQKGIIGGFFNDVDGLYTVWIIPGNEPTVDLPKEEFITQKDFDKAVLFLADKHLFK